ncbi:hypothetical protein SAMN04488003_105165 [Loktanella fryxellensis]|uniref:Uncharacterized protein n=1 Tax=Loktanella fryxellensis TaxID=245187 RepID=A0A1H8BTI8_9RHOB|nr:hypothetical protein SAMN04488003_105165 [Loktanella fryxellensis]
MRGADQHTAAAHLAAPPVAPPGPPSIRLRVALRLTTAPPRRRLAQAVPARTRSAVDLAVEDAVPQGWRISGAGPTWDGIWQSYPDTQTSCADQLGDDPHGCSHVVAHLQMCLIAVARQHRLQDRAVFGLR